MGLWMKVCVEIYGAGGCGVFGYLLYDNLSVPVRVTAPSKFELGVQGGGSDVEGVLQDRRKETLYSLAEAHNQGGAVGGGRLGQMLAEAENTRQSETDRHMSVRLCVCLSVSVHHIPGLSEGLQSVRELPQQGSLCTTQPQFPWTAHLLQEIHRVQQPPKDLYQSRQIHKDY